MVGDGPVRAELEKLAMQLGIADRVRFTGVIDRLERAELVRRVRDLHDRRRIVVEMAGNAEREQDSPGHQTFEMGVHEVARRLRRLLACLAHRDPKQKAVGKDRRAGDDQDFQVGIHSRNQPQAGPPRRIIHGS